MGRVGKITKICNLERSHGLLDRKHWKGANAKQTHHGRLKTQDGDEAGELA